MSYRLIIAEDLREFAKGKSGETDDPLLNNTIIPAVGLAFAQYCKRPDFDRSIRTEYFDVSCQQSRLFVKSPPIAPIITSLRTSSLRWVLSAAGAGIYYVELIGGGSASLANPTSVSENGVELNRKSSAVGLLAGEFFYGDADALGFNTVYVRLSDSADPDSKELDYVEHRNLLTRVWEDSSVPRAYQTELVQWTDFLVDDQCGSISRFKRYFLPGPKAVKCTYTGGYLTGDAAGAPEDLRFAAIMQTMIFYQRREELGVTSRSLEGGSISLLQPTLPKSVTNVLDQYRRFVY